MNQAVLLDAAEQFFAMFAHANEAIWPMQIVWYLAALGALVLAIRPIGKSSRLISAFLVLYYIWIGVVFHWLFYQPINPSAWAYGVMFVLGGVLWFVAGVARSDLVFRPIWDASAVIGGVFVLYALVLYPIFGMLGGHLFPAAPVFGIAPCPTTIFTFGLLLWTRGPTPKPVLVVPLVWSLMAFPGALRLGVVEDLGMPIAAIVGTVLILWRDRTSPQQVALAGLALATLIVASGHDDILIALGLVVLVIAVIQDFPRRGRGRIDERAVWPIPIVR